MVYVQWLRVRNVLKFTGIIFGCIFALALVLHFALARFGSYDAMINGISLDPGTTTQHVLLFDGTKRTILDNAKDHTHVVIDDHGYAGKQVTITEPSSRQRATHEHVTMGSVSVISSRNGKTATTVIDTNAPTDFRIYIAFAVTVAFILATILGAPFARENDGHLEIALTKPIARVPLALQMMAVDAIGIIGGFVLAIVAFIAINTIFQVPHIVVGGDSLLVFASGMVLTLAWYACLAAASASLRRGYGAVLGFAWPVALAVALLALLPLGGSLLGEALHGIFRVLAFFDPLSYASFSAGNVSPDTQTLSAGATIATRLPYTTILLILYTALAVIQWRRVEA